MKKTRPILALIGFLGFIGLLLYNGFTAKSDMRVVNLALTKTGKTYIFSKMGTALVEQDIAAQKSPSVFPYLKILVDKDLYISPAEMEDFCKLLAGDYQLHPYQETSYDGYISTGAGNTYQLNTQNQSTEKVGEQELVFNIELQNAKGAKMAISWSQIQMSTQVAAQENCQVRSFMIVTNPHPGETVGSRKKFVVVKLQDLIDFYNPALSLEYNEEEQLLYIKE